MLSASSKSCPFVRLSVNPSRLFEIKEARTAALSLRGVFITARSLVNPWSPSVKSADPKASSVEGAAVITFIAPPVEF